MNLKILSIFIIFSMTLGSFGVVGNTVKVENDCGCSSSEKDFDYQEYISYWETRLSPKTKVTMLGNPPSSFSWKNADLDSNGHGISGNKNFMTSVKGQGSCGSCWAFAFIGVVEAVINIEAEKADADAPHPDLDLSEQYLVSCASDDIIPIPPLIPDYCDGCKGANFPTPWPAPSFFEWAMDDDNGVVLESCFGYQAVDSNGCNSNDCNNTPVTCKRDCEIVADVVDYEIVSSSRNDIKNALIRHGPLYASIKWYTDIKSLGSGVYQYDGESPHEGDHSLIIVGYANTPDNPDYNGYWIVKNSMRYWANSGYGKIAYGEIDIEIDTAYIEVDYDADPVDPEPDLEAEGSLSASGDAFEDDVFLGTITIRNAGGSELAWEIEVPDIECYNWDFDGSDGVSYNALYGYLTPEDGDLELDVSVKLPKAKRTTFSGYLKVSNSEDSSDFENIYVTVTTPKIKLTHPFFSNIFAKLPILKGFLQNFLSTLNK